MTDMCVTCMSETDEKEWFNYDHFNGGDGISSKDIHCMLFHACPHEV